MVNLCLLYGALGTSQGDFTQSSGLCSRPPARPFHVLEKIVNPATMREKSLLTLLRISSHEKEGLEAPLPSCVGVGLAAPPATSI